MWLPYPWGGARDALGMRQAASILQEFFRKSFRPQNARNSRVACVAQNAFTIRKRANPNRRRLHHLKRPGNPWRDNSASSSSAAKRRRSSPRRAEASPVGSGNGIIRARREQHANRAQVRSNAYSYRLPAYKLDTVDSSQFVTRTARATSFVTSFVASRHFTRTT